MVQAFPRREVPSARARIFRRGGYDMGATTAAREFRLRNGDFARYLRGSGIDIGAGDDHLSVPDGVVLAWDHAQGDAQTMDGVAAASFDFVYSSHCLEHLHDPLRALERWCQILRPGGFLYLVVPDWRLYEKEQWPSRFNSTHRHTFSLDVERDTLGRSGHLNICSEILPLLARCGLEPLAVRLEDEGYDHDLPSSVDQTLNDALAQICVIARKEPEHARAPSLRTWVRVGACAFFVYHWLAVTTWHLPGPLGHGRSFFEKYMVHSGSWQFWNMFDTAPSLSGFDVEIHATDARRRTRVFAPLLPELAPRDGYLRHDVFFFRTLYGNPDSPFLIDYARNVGEAIRRAGEFDPVSITFRIREDRIRRLDEIRADGVVATTSTFDRGPIPCD
ncbi:MAG: methyltransferase domain-containing protein [Planctomycetota bacterium]